MAPLAGQYVNCSGSISLFTRYQRWVRSEVKATGLKWFIARVQSLEQEPHTMTSTDVLVEIQCEIRAGEKLLQHLQDHHAALY